LNAVAWPPVVTVMPAGQLMGGWRALAPARNAERGRGRRPVRYEGAGNLYQEYCYEVKGEERSFVVDVVIRSHAGCGDGQCGAYCGTPNERECRELDRHAAYEDPLEKMMGTFVVFQRP
jgi:hypothetical protein